MEPADVSGLEQVLKYLALGAKDVDAQTFIQLATKAARALPGGSALDAQQPATGASQGHPTGAQRPQQGAGIPLVPSQAGRSQHAPAHGGDAQDLDVDAQPPSSPLPPASIEDLCATVAIGLPSCNRRPLASILLKVQHQQDDQQQYVQAQQQQSHRSSYNGSEKQEGSSSSTDTDEEMEVEDPFAPQYCFVARKPGSCKVSTNMPEALEGHLQSNEDWSAFLCSEHAAVNEERRLVLQQFKMLNSARPCLPDLSGTDLRCLVAEAAVEVHSDDEGSMVGSPQGSQGSIDIKSSPEDEGHDTASSGAIGADGAEEEEEEEEEQEGEDEDVEMHPLLEQVAELNRAQRNWSKGELSAGFAPSAAEGEHRQALAEALGNILGSSGVLLAATDGDSGEGPLQPMANELIAKLSGNAEGENLGLFSHHLASLQKSLQGEAMVLLMQAIAEGVSSLIEHWQQCKLPHEKARASEIWLAARTHVKRGVIVTVSAAAGLGNTDDVERTLLQVWQAELAHWQDRLMGLVEDLARTHRDGVEAFMYEKDKYCRNYLETTVHDIQDLLFKIQIGNTPTCPENVPLPEALQRQRKSPEGSLLSELMVDEVDVVLQAAGKKKKAGVGMGGEAGNVSSSRGIATARAAVGLRDVAGAQSGLGNGIQGGSKIDQDAAGKSEELGSSDTEEEGVSGEQGEGGEEGHDDDWLVEDDMDTGAQDQDTDGEKLLDQEASQGDEDVTENSEVAGPASVAWNAAHLKTGITQVLGAKTSKKIPPPTPPAEAARQNGLGAEVVVNGDTGMEGAQPGRGGAQQVSGGEEVGGVQAHEDAHGARELGAPAYAEAAAELAALGKASGASGGNVEAAEAGLEQVAGGGEAGDSVAGTRAGDAGVSSLGGMEVFEWEPMACKPALERLHGQQQVQKGDLVHRRSPCSTSASSARDVGPYAVWLPGFVVCSLQAERCTLSMAGVSCSLNEKLDAVRPQALAAKVRAPLTTLILTERQQQAQQIQQTPTQQQQQLGQQVGLLEWGRLVPGSIVEVPIAGEQISLEPLVLLRHASNQRSSYRYLKHVAGDSSNLPSSSAPGAQGHNSSWLGFRICHAPCQPVTPQHFIIVDKEKGGPGICAGPYFTYNSADGSWSRVLHDKGALMVGLSARNLVLDAVVASKLTTLRRSMDGLDKEAVKAACQRIMARSLSRNPTSTLPKCIRMIGCLKKTHYCYDNKGVQKANNGAPAAPDHPASLPSPLKRPAERQMPEGAIPVNKVARISRGADVLDVGPRASPLSAGKKGRSGLQARNANLRGAALNERKETQRRAQDAAFMAASQDHYLAGAAGQAAGDKRLFEDRPVPLIYGELARVLKAHQVEGLQFLWRNLCDNYQEAVEEEYRGGVILAHTMGLGKSLTTIAFLHMYFKYRKAELKEEPLGRALLVVPANVLYNFQNELRHWLPKETGQYESPLVPSKIFLADGKTAHQTIRTWYETPGGVLLISSHTFSGNVLDPNGTEGKEAGKKRRKSTRGAAKTVDIAAGGDMIRGGCTDADASRGADEGLLQQQQQQQQPGAGEAKPSDAKSKKATSFDEEIKRLLLKGPEIVAVDEAHEMRNPTTNFCQAINQVNTKRRIALTGYPLQNTLNEYYVMINWVTPGLMGSPADFKEEFTDAIELGRKQGASTAEKAHMEMALSVLEDLTKDTVQVRGYDILVAELAASGVSKTEHVVLLQLSKEQGALYQAYLEALRRLNIKGRFFRDTKMLEQICNTPAQLEQKLKELSHGAAGMGDMVEVPFEDTSGQIEKVQIRQAIIQLVLQCCNQLREQAALTADGHVAAAAAAAAEAAQRLRNAQAGAGAGSMPLGQPPTVEALLAEKAADVEAKQEALARLVDLWGCTPKLRFFEGLLRECQRMDEKLVVFSESLSMQSAVLASMKQPIWGPTGTQQLSESVYWQIQGKVSPQQRAKRIAAFQEHKGFGVILMSTKAGSVGINLTSACRLVIFDAPWNPVHNAQAIARIHRLGQKKPTFTYWLLYKNTVEECIYKSNIAKEELFKRVVDKKPVKKVSDTEKAYYEYEVPRRMRLQDLQAEMEKFGSNSDVVLSALLFGNQLPSSSSAPCLAGGNTGPLAPLVAGYHLKESQLHEDETARMTKSMKRTATKHFLQQGQRAGSAVNSRRLQLLQMRSARRIEDSEDEEDPNFAKLLMEKRKQHHHMPLQPDAGQLLSLPTYTQHTLFLQQCKLQELHCTARNIQLLKESGVPTSAGQLTLLLQGYTTLQTELSLLKSNEQQQQRHQRQQQQQHSPPDAQQQKSTVSIALQPQPSMPVSLQQQQQQQEQQPYSTLHTLDDTSRVAPGVEDFQSWYTSSDRRTFFARMQSVGQTLPQAIWQKCARQLSLLKDQAAALQKVQQVQSQLLDIISNGTAGVGISCGREAADVGVGTGRASSSSGSGMLPRGYSTEEQHQVHKRPRLEGQQQQGQSLGEASPAAAAAAASTVASSQLHSHEAPQCSSLTPLAPPLTQLQSPSDAARHAAQPSPAGQHLAKQLNVDIPRGSAGWQPDTPHATPTPPSLPHHATEPSTRSRRSGSHTGHLHAGHSSTPAFLPMIVDMTQDEDSD